MLATGPASAFVVQSQKSDPKFVHGICQLPGSAGHRIGCSGDLARERQRLPGQGFIEMGGALDAVEDAMQTIAFWFARCSVQK